MTEIRIIEHKFLPPGTIMVSSDIAKLLREQYTDAEKDRAFLKALGIKAAKHD